MTEIIDTDILIVGGGPAGLAVASRLGSDVSALLVHQDREIGKSVRTSGGCWLSDAQALGIPDTLYRPVFQTDIFADNSEMQLDMTTDPVVILDVTGLYKWLATQSKAEIRTGTKFLSTKKNGIDYVSTLRNEVGEFEVRSRYIVDASGWHCAVLDSLGLAEKSQRRGVGIEYEYPITTEMNRAILFFGSAVLSGYGWAFPTNYGTLRLGVGIITPDTDASPKDLMEKFLASDALTRMGLPAPQDHHVNAGIIPSIPFESQMVFGRVIRVGDSANMATPVLGEGIRHCIEYGRKLGWALKADLSARDGKPLKRWEKQARRKLGLQYRVGFWANKAAASYNRQDWDRAVNRLSQLPPEEAIAFLRNEFSPPMMLKRAAKMLWRKFRR